MTNTMTEFGDVDEGALATAGRLMQDEAPELPKAPDGMVTLPGGVMVEGRWQREARVRELTGEDEEALVKLLAAKNPVEYLDAVIVRGVEHIGGRRVDDELARRLLVGDRDHLFVAVRRATYGDFLEFENVVCPSCSAQLDASVDLVKELPVRECPEAQKGIFQVKGKQNLYEIRLPTSEDQRALYTRPNETFPEMNTILLSRCLHSIDGVLLLNQMEVPETVVRKLGAGDRRKLVKFLTETQPGPRLQEVKVPCSSCRFEIPMPLDLASLLSG